MNVEAVGNMDLEHQHSRRESEDAVAERGETAKILCGNAIVEGHGATSSYRNRRVNARIRGGPRRSGERLRRGLVRRPVFRPASVRSISRRSQGTTFMRWKTRSRTPARTLESDWKNGVIA